MEKSAFLKCFRRFIVLENDHLVLCHFSLLFWRFEYQFIALLTNICFIETYTLQKEEMCQSELEGREWRWGFLDQACFHRWHFSFHSNSFDHQLFGLVPWQSALAQGSTDSTSSQGEFISFIIKTFSFWKQNAR